MSLVTTDYAKALEIDSRRALEAELDRVVEIAVQHALDKKGHGILVTRHGPGSFAVELAGRAQGTIAERPTRGGVLKRA